jgi:hypothetical protein
MMRPVSARERRLVALLILVALVAAAYYLLIVPVAAGFAARAAERERLTLRYVHDLRTIAAIPRLRREAEAMHAALGDYVSDARTVEAGREALRDRLQAVLARSGGTLGDSEDAEGAPGWARIRATARLTLPQLVALLDQVQHQRPWLVIEGLSVTAAEGAPGNAMPLEVDLDVSVPIRTPALR